MTSLPTRTTIRCLKTSCNSFVRTRPEFRSLSKRSMCQPGSSNLRPPASPTTLEHKLRKLLVGDELLIVAMRPRDGDEVKVADQGGEEIQEPSLPLEVATSLQDQTPLALTPLTGVQLQQRPVSLPSVQPPDPQDLRTAAGAPLAWPTPLQALFRLRLLHTQTFPSSHGNQLLRQVVGNPTWVGGHRNVFLAEQLTSAAPPSDWHLQRLLQNHPLTGHPHPLTQWT